MADLKIIPKNLKYREDAKEVLEQAIKNEFDAVFVFGVKNGRVQIDHSGAADGLWMIGCLETAKVMIINGLGYLENE